MSALSRQPELPLRSPEWQPEVVQRLDEAHLVAWSDSVRRRVQFGSQLAAFLSRQRDTEVCTLYGSCVTCLESFCNQLERSIPGRQLLRRIDGPGGVTSLLRSRAETAVRIPSKYRFYIWHDADELLRADRGLFGRLADAIMGVAAEAEYASDDLLLLHRAVFVGSSRLELYSQDPYGQFCVWASDGVGGAHAEPFWQLVTGVDHPPVERVALDSLLP
jgi:hypothetical protein